MVGLVWYENFNFRKEKVFGKFQMFINKRAKKSKLMAKSQSIQIELPI